VDFSRMGGDRPEPSLSLANSEEAKRLRDVIWEAVGRLAPPQKTAVLLFYAENKSCQDIGVVLGIPAVTVKSHLHRARARLRTLLSADLVDDWMAVRDLRDSKFA
jgi:RNA polymerase sigma-70 factor (ECF subfamily)